MKTSLRPIVGNWADEESFFDREHELAELCEKIRRGASVSLGAPRRIGKTSLLRAVARALDTEMTCIFVDLEASSSPEEAIAAIAERAEQHQQLASRVRSWASWLLGTTAIETQLGRVDLRDALKVDWQKRGDRLFRELCGGERPVVLFLDELPVLIATLLAEAESTKPARSGADLFLSWLRRLTQEHKDVLRVVITGSIGLAPMVARAGLSTTLNVYEPARLDPWPREIAIAASRALAAYEELTLTDGAAEAVYELLGVGVPYHVQLVHQAVSEDARRRAELVVTPADVVRVWNERVLARPSADLPHWEQRLRKALPEADYDLAVSLLTEAALREPLTAPTALHLHSVREQASSAALARLLAPGALASSRPRPQELVRAILDSLEHDGYLAHDASGWFFPNRLLRAWWADRYGPLHEPQVKP